jgi:hypothetical protein
MKLPDPERTIIEEGKLADYCLNSNHPDGRHKARVFKSALDLKQEDVETLKKALLEAVKTYEATPDKRNQYGQKYVIDFPMTHGGKRAIIHSVWIVRDEEKRARLVTCYIV